VKTLIVVFGKYGISFDLSIAKRFLAVVLVSIATGLILFTQTGDEKIPEENQLLEITNVTVRKSIGKNQGLIFQGMQTANTKNQNFSWFVSKHDFNEGLQIDLIVDSFSKNNQQIPISIYVFDGNAVKKVWVVKFGRVEVMSYERAKQTFEIDARLSRGWRCFALFLFGIAIVAIVRIEKTVVTGDEK
jgi:hypothetical protein